MWLAVPGVLRGVRLVHASLSCSCCRGTLVLRGQPWGSGVWGDGAAVGGILLVQLTDEFANDGQLLTFETGRQVPAVRHVVTGSVSQNPRFMLGGHSLPQQP